MILIIVILLLMLEVLTHKIFYIKRKFVPAALLPGLNGVDDDGQVFMFKKL